MIPLARGRTWNVDRPQVMGILNATPDSFSDGGEIADADALDARIRTLLADGADCLDVGGESTRPGHTPVSADEETARVVPVVEAIRRLDADVVVSIDTGKAVVADAALAAGADLVNDVSALGDAGMADVLQRHGCGIVLMRHLALEGDARNALRHQFTEILDCAERAGIPLESIVLDPGLGFGDRPGPDVADNLVLLDEAVACAMGRPVLIGHSRKRFVAAMGAERGLDRDAMTAELSRRAVDAGASIVRVHDVAATVAALQTR